MKKFLTTLFAISSLFVFAQTPSALGINYQSIIRNTGGTVMASTPVTVEFKLYSTATFTNVVLYHETHSTTTNQFGMANLIIGQGTVVGGAVTFNNIPWIGGVAYEVYVNSNIVGSRQPFLSVPYALASAYAPAPNVTFSNNVLSVGGNTVSITSGSTYTAGNGISISSSVITSTGSVIGTGAASVTGSYPNYTINVPAGTTLPTGKNGQFLYNNGTIWDTLPRNNLYFDGTNFGIGTTLPAANFHVNGDAKFNSSVTTPQIYTTNFKMNGTNSGYVLTSDGSGNGTWQASVAPTLSLSGTTLTSGTATNSVNLSLLPGIWSNSVGVLFPTTLTNSVGVGTSGPLTDKMEINHASSTANTHLHLKQTGADAFSRIKFTNAIAPSKFWLSTVTSAAADANSGHNFFYNNGSVGHNVFTVAGNGRVSVNTFSTMTNAILDVNGALEIDSSFVVNAISGAPSSASNAGKIYFDATAQKFKVSENGGAFVNLIPTSSSPWLQGTGLVYLTNSTDNVGIGTTSPVATLDVNGNIRVNDKIFLGNVGGINTGYTGIYEENDDLKLAVFKPGAAATTFGSAGNSIDALVVKSQTGYVGIGTTNPVAALNVVNNYTAGVGMAVGISDSNNPSKVVEVTQNGLGIAGDFFINNNSNASPALSATTNGIAEALLAIHMGTTGRAGVFATQNNSNTSATLFSQTAGLGTAGFFENINTTSTSNAVTAVTYGTGSTIFANNQGTAGNAGHFNIPGGSTNTSAALFASNIASGNAFNAQANTGSAINASNTGSLSATIYGTNAQDGDVVFANATRGRAFYGMNSSTTGLSTMELASNGNGNVIFAYKNSGASSGNVATFSNNSTSNTSDAILIVDNGQGNALYVAKPASTTSGNTAKFDNLSTGNSADAVFVTNNGGGAALHTVNGAPVAGSNNLGLLIENGHIGSLASTNLTIASSCTTCTAPTVTLDNHSTDIVGTLRAVFSSTPAVVVDLKVTFIKPYKKRPVVIVNVESTPDPINSYPKYLVTPIGVVGNYTGFKISIIQGSINTAGSYGFNYMVIEGKN